MSTNSIRFCNHLIVRDIKSNEIVGTYRMMRGAQARQHSGFYSEKEFDLSQIKKLDGELLELGRSCARKDFRDRALLPLMWEAIAEHVRAHQVRYLFGCGSLYTTDVAEVRAIFALLKNKYYAPDTLPCRARGRLPLYRFVGCAKSAAPMKRRCSSKLPSLIKGYLRIGALVCGPPALDAEFGTADFFLLLDFDTFERRLFKTFRLGGCEER